MHYSLKSCVLLNLNTTNKDSETCKRRTKTTLNLNAYNKFNATKMRGNKKSGQYLAILFDLDNTLIATRHGDRLACNKIADILSEKHNVPEEEASPIVNNYLIAYRKCPDNTEMPLDLWRNLLWKNALGKKYEYLTGEIYNNWLQLRYKYLALKPEIINFLQELRRSYLLALITNGPSCAQWEKVNKLNLHPFFDKILVSGDLPWEKPSEEIFHEACGYLGVEPQQCLMVGDKLETDILGGIQANLGATVWVPLPTENPQNLQRQNLTLNPTYIVKEVTDLLKILPKKTETQNFRDKKNKNNKFCTQPDLDDSSSNSSNSSDGS